MPDERHSEGHPSCEKSDREDLSESFPIIASDLIFLIERGTRRDRDEERQGRERGTRRDRDEREGRGEANESGKTRKQRVEGLTNLNRDNKLLM
jgi:hypothetical protein